MNSALHVSENERFQLDKTKFLKDEHSKQLYYDIGRLEKIKTYQEKIQNKIKIDYEKQTELEKCKLKKKGENQWAYEQVKIRKSKKSLFLFLYL